MPKDCFHSCSILGAFFASNPISDGAIVYHGPTGCVKMVLYAACAHDLAGFDSGKVTLSEVSSPEAIMGGVEKLRARIERLLDRSPKTHVFVVSTCASEIVGDDLVSIIHSFPPGSVTLLGGAGFRGDLWSGYSDALARIAADMCTEAPGAAPSGKLVNLLGYVCDRLEQDHLANLRALRGMAEGIGLGVNAVFVGPGDTSGLRRAWAARHNVAFDYGVKAAECLAGRYSQSSVHVDYPLGLGGTISFLRELGRATGRAKAAESYIDAQLRLAVPPIESVRGVCLGKRVGVCAESQKLPGLVGLLRDLGMRPAWIQVTDRQEGVLSRLRRELGAGFDRVRINPPLPRDAREAGDGDVDIIVGSSVEKYRYGERIPVYEFTYPCFDRHCLTAEPDLGFEGAVRLANNLANLLSRANTRTWGLSRELSRMGLETVLYGRNRPRQARPRRRP